MLLPLLPAALSPEAAAAGPEAVDSDEPAAAAAAADAAAGAAGAGAGAAAAATEPRTPESQRLLRAPAVATGTANDETAGTGPLEAADAEESASAVTAFACCAAIISAFLASSSVDGTPSGFSCAETRSPHRSATNAMAWPGRSRKPPSSTISLRGSGLSAAARNSCTVAMRTSSSKPFSSAVSFEAIQPLTSTR